MTGKPGTRTSPNWPSQVLGEMLKLYAEGLSASLIAKALNQGFGCSFSRNAVIGKCHRLGLRREGASAPTKAKPYPVRRASATTRAASPKKNTCRTQGSGKCSPVAMPATPLHIVSPFAKPFAEREAGQCWWPYGEGADMLSCCAPIQRGGLCESHAAIGLKPPLTKAERQRAASLFAYLARAA